MGPAPAALSCSGAQPTEHSQHRGEMGIRPEQADFDAVELTLLAGLGHDASIIGAAIRLAVVIRQSPVLYPADSLPVPGPACSSSRSVLVRSPQRIFHPPSRSTAVRSRPLRVRPRRFTMSSMCVPPAGPGLVA
jgi:hypothetical protein